MESTGSSFLDVAALLQASQTRPRTNWFWYVVGLFALVVMGASYFSSQTKESEALVDAGSLLLMLGIGAAMAMMTWRSMKAQRYERQQIESIEETVQLRRWDQAASLLQSVLGQPMRVSVARVQALIFLSAVLARYHRFNDAITVQNYLIERHLLDPASEYGLRLGRAMAMLREDHLVDANQAISEIRRMVGDQLSGGLALIEIYRDIRTGHAAEAVEIFHANLKALREQLSHRVADAYGMVACACDQLGRFDEAAQYFLDATTLTSASELARRYPEIEKLVEKYPAAPVPKEAA